jgi:hypothetical protein
VSDEGTDYSDDAIAGSVVWACCGWCVFDGDDVVGTGGHEAFDEDMGDCGEFTAEGDEALHIIDMSCGPSGVEGQENVSWKQRSKNGDDFSQSDDFRLIFERVIGETAEDEAAFDGWFGIRFCDR